MFGIRVGKPIQVIIKSSTINYPFGTAGYVTARIITEHDTIFAFIGFVLKVALRPVRPGTLSTATSMWKGISKTETGYLPTPQAAHQ
jgi:hypothetical protein